MIKDSPMTPKLRIILLSFTTQQKTWVSTFCPSAI